MTVHKFKRGINVMHEVSLLQEIVTFVGIGGPFFAIYMYLIATYYRDRDDQNSLSSR